MSQPTLPSPNATGWTLLARGEQEHDAVNRCPAGHVHLDYGNFSVRFHRDEFLAYAGMIAQASAHLQGAVWPESMARPVPRPSTLFSTN